jgi:hypothetical protein
MKEKKSQIILLIISVLVIVVSFFLTRQSSSYALDQYLFWGDILKNTGLTILTVVVITFLWNLLGGDPVNNSITKLDGTLKNFQDSVKLLEDSKVSGLERVLAVSGKFGSHDEWMGRLKAAEKVIDLMGYDILVWTKGENFENEISTLVSRGVKIRVLIMDETNPHLEAFMNLTQITSISINVVKENIKLVKNVFSNIKSSLNHSLQPHLEMKTLKKGLIPMQICRTDNNLTMVQYIFSEIASRSPILVVKGEESSLYKIYQNEFDKLWELSTNF